MADANERFDRIEQSLTRLDKDLSGRIARLDEHLSGRLDRLDERLEQVAKGIAPLKDLRDFVQRIADDHERRITEVEKGT
jgi:gamma-glutamyl phosphate reductase